MSSGFAPTDDLVFGIRIDKTRIGQDMRAANDELRKEVEKTKAGLEKLSTMTPKVDTSRQVADTARLRREVEAASLSAKELAVNTEGVGKSMENATTGAVRLGKALLIARIAADGLKAVADTIDLGKAIKSGDLERVEAAKGELRESLEGIPAAGPLAKQIVRFGDVPGVGGGAAIVGDIIAEVRNRLNKRGTANASGTMTEEEWKEFEKDQAKLEAKMKENDKLIARGKAQQEEAQAVVRAVQGEIAREGKSKTEVAILNAQDRLADFDRKIEARGATGKALTPEEQDARRALEGRVVDAQAKDASAKINTVVQAGKSFAAEFQQRAASAMEAQIHGQSELVALQAEAAGDHDTAEKERFEESVRQRLAAAQKVGAVQVQIVEQVAEAERAALLKTQQQRKDADHERVVMATQDIDTSTEVKRLRREGNNADADAVVILRNTERAMADAEKNLTGMDRVERQRAIIMGAEEDILGIRADRRQTADVVAESAAMRMNLFGGSGDDDTKSFQTGALEALRSIDKKMGHAIARAGP